MMSVGTLMTQRIHLNDFFGDENLPFCYKKGPKQHGEGNFLKKIQTKLPLLKDESCEIDKILEGFSQISTFLLLKLSYLANKF
jgi:hypothetical protein